MNDFFDEDFEPTEEKVIEFTKDEFIAKAKALLQKIEKGHTDCYVPVKGKDGENEDCRSCNGMLAKIEGGNVVDCRSCDGTGENRNHALDETAFCEFIEHEIVWSDEPFFDLINCNIKND
jgi:hypothetical protein